MQRHRHPAKVRWSLLYEGSMCGARRGMMHVDFAARDSTTVRTQRVC